MIRPLEACNKQFVKCRFLCRIFCDGDFAEGSDTAVQFLASLRIHSIISISISSASEFHLTMLLPKRFLQDSKTAYPAPSARSLSQGRSHRLPCLRTLCCTGRPTWSGAAGASLDTRGGGLATSTHRGISKRQWLAYSEDTRTTMNHTEVDLLTW